MPAIKDPVKEARRIAAVRAALARDQTWLKGAAGGNFTPEGRRRSGQNRTISGAKSTAVRLAGRYVSSVLDSLGRGGIEQHTGENP
jgi:hypothetical protein